MSTLDRLAVINAKYPYHYMNGCFVIVYSQLLKSRSFLAKAVYYHAHRQLKWYEKYNDYWNAGDDHKIYQEMINEKISKNRTTV